MTLDQAAAVEESLSRAGELCPDPTARVYARLFAERPELEALFVLGADAKGHMLQEAFSAILDWIGPRAYAPALIAAERVNHDNLGVPPDVFPTFFSTVQAEVRAILGRAWTPAMEAGWGALLTELGD